MLNNSRSWKASVIGILLLTGIILCSLSSYH